MIFLIYFEVRYGSFVSGEENGLGSNLFFGGIITSLHNYERNIDN